MNRNSVLYKVLKRIEKPDGKKLFAIMNPVMNKSLAVCGRLITKSMKKSFPGKTILLMPSRSAGDMYFLKYSFEDMLKKAGIKDYLLIVDRATCYKSALSCGFENVYPVGMIKQKALLMYQATEKRKKTGIINCYPWCMFDLNRAKNLTPKKIIAHSECQKKLQEEYGLIPGKSVILSPYENSISEKGLPTLPEAFWAEIAHMLKKDGYSVFTNSNGSESEPVISGTNRIFPLFSEVQDAVDMAGYCVAVRSGFVDFMAQSTARKIVLYPTKEYLQCWSLHRVGGAENSTEIIYDECMNQQDDLVYRVYRLIKNQ